MNVRPLTRLLVLAAALLLALAGIVGGVWLMEAFVGWQSALGLLLALFSFVGGLYVSLWHLPHALGDWRDERRKPEPFPSIILPAEAAAAFDNLKRAQCDATAAFLRWQAAVTLAHEAFDDDEITQAAVTFDLDYPFADKEYPRLYMDDDTAEIAPCQSRDEEQP